MKLSDQMRAQIAGLVAQRSALHDEQATVLAAVEKRDNKALTDDEQKTYDEKRAAKKTLDEEIDTCETRLAEIVDEETRDAKAAEHRAKYGHVGEQRTSNLTVNEPNPVYRRGDVSGASYFRDLALAARPQSQGFEEARTRLAAAQETRAGDMTTVAGAGGEFAPPLWLVEDFVALARAGRVTADLCNQNTLPAGVSSVNLPKVSTGTTVAVQATQNSAVSDTAMTTTSVSSGITTLAGKQIISMQLIEQSGIPFDRVVLQDLALAYAVQLDTQVLYGTNANGQLNGLVGLATNTAFTSATPAPASVTNANSLYYTVTKAAVAIQTSRYLPADAIVMHPRRWGWILGSVDSNSRPLVIPAGPQFNGLGNTGQQPAQGFAGTFGSYNVYLDPNISITANSATNQDEVYVLRRADLELWETPVQSASFDATYADNLSVLYRVHGYAAFIGNRYAASVQSLRGTGLIAP